MFKVKNRSRHESLLMLSNNSFDAQCGNQYELELVNIKDDCETSVSVSQ